MPREFNMRAFGVLTAKLQTTFFIMSFLIALNIALKQKGSLFLFDSLTKK